ncbi:hypothetical protein BU16DRAFT_17952 [Lophium mytilinum]|uniref:Uncharacterized protein n=1 Tax=Lophium mytilinum TaxID=390894 RepID=A0A6A6RDH6_9PEZI|nr:hypothetical protein BU16DRAFT_17952 [Lophium mytilinum]
MTTTSMVTRHQIRKEAESKATAENEKAEICDAAIALIRLHNDEQLEYQKLREAQDTSRAAFEAAQDRREGSPDSQSTIDEPNVPATCREGRAEAAVQALRQARRTGAERLDAAATMLELMHVADPAKGRAEVQARNERIERCVKKNWALGYPDVTHPAAKREMERQNNELLERNKPRLTPKRKGKQVAAPNRLRLTWNNKKADREKSEEEEAERRKSEEEAERRKSEEEEAERRKSEEEENAESEDDHRERGHVSRYLLPWSRKGYKGVMKRC